MRTIGKAFLIILTVIAILAGILVAAVFGIYQAYFAPTPAAFEFAKPEDMITGFELVSAKLTDDKIEFTTFAKVEDPEKFKTDIKSLECFKGISFDAITEMREKSVFEAIVVNYADGTYEMITPYVSLSPNFTSGDFSLENLFDTNFYFFNSTEFSNLIEIYDTK